MRMLIMAQIEFMVGQFGNDVCFVHATRAGGGEGCWTVVERLRRMEWNEMNRSDTFQVIGSNFRTHEINWS